LLGTTFFVGETEADNDVNCICCSASINFNLSLNGTVSLGADGLNINQAGVVGGDLLKILVLQHDVR